MILKSLELSNFKTIKDFKKDFNGDVYIVSGENEQGKSTLIEAVAIALTGQTTEVLKLGEKKGFLKAVIGDDGNEYNVELKFTEKNPKGNLTITDKAGVKTKTVSALRSIFQYVDFDVNEFVIWGETSKGRLKQVEVIKNLLDNDVLKKLSDLDTKISEDFEKRTVANGELKVFTSLLNEKKEKVSVEDLTVYVEPKELSVLTDKKIEATAHNIKIDGVSKRIEDRDNRLLIIPSEIEKNNNRLKEDALIIDKEVEEAKRKYEELLLKAKDSVNNRKLVCDDANQLLNDEIEDIKLKNAGAKKWISANEKKPIEAIDLEINQMEDHNKKCALVGDYIGAKMKFNESKFRFDKLDNSIKSNRLERENTIKTAHLPVAGLSFNDDGLMLNGIPFKRGSISTSQEMEVAVKILMIMNPKSKIFRIARGESLGAARLKDIVDFAKDNGFQGFIEEVKRGQNEMIVSEYTENND